MKKLNGGIIEITKIHAFDECIGVTFKIRQAFGEYDEFSLTFDVEEAEELVKKLPAEIQKAKQSKYYQPKEDEA